jgi:hypothetical protein
MEQPLKSQKIIIIGAIVAIISVAIFFLANYESLESKINRLNTVAKTLPEFNGRHITSNQIADGECEELTDSSALPVLVDKHKIDEEKYVRVKQQFIDATKQKGIVWKDSNSRPSALFVRDGKKYKLAAYKSSHPDGVYYNVSLTACN